MALYPFGNKLYFNGRVVPRVEDVVVDERKKMADDMRTVLKALADGTPIEPTPQNAATFHTLLYLRRQGIKPALGAKKHAKKKKAKKALTKK